MTLTLKIDGAGRGATLKELHAFAVGDLYNPLVLDFSSLGAEGAGQVDLATLSLAVMRGAAGDVVASVPMFSRVPGHWAEARAALLLSNDQLDAWFDEAVGEGDDAVRAVAWLEIADASRTYAACEVPILLRRSSARGEGDLAGYYTASQVDALLALKQAALSFDSSPTSGSANPVTSGGVFAALAAKADLAAMTTALADKADASGVAAALAGKADAADVTAALAGKANAADVTAALASTVTTSALATALEGYATTSALNLLLANYATTAALEAAIAGVPGLADMTAALAAKADQSAVTAALALKANAADMTAALALKADAAAMTTALAGKVGTAAFEAALADKADASDVETALAGKADATDVTAALALKANAAAVEAALALKADASTVASQISALATKAELEAAIAGVPSLSAMAAALALKADASAMTTALAAKADASALASLAAAVEGKADASAVYTKTEVDNLLAALPDTSGPSGGQPVIFFTDDSDVIPVQSGGDTLVNVVGAVFEGTALSRLALVGVDSRWSGSAELNADNDFEAAFAGGGTASYDADGGVLTLTYGGVSIAASVTIPSGGVGVPASPLADASPTSGNMARLVSSGGVAAALEGKVSAALHAEDLYATRLIAAQNATSAARAANAAAHNLRLILDLEARLDGAEEEEEEP